MQVVDPEHDGIALGQHFERARQLADHALLGRALDLLLEGGALAGVAQRGKGGQPHGRVAAQGLDGGRRAHAGDEALQRFEQGQVGLARPVVLDALAVAERGRARDHRAAQEALDQRRLADAGLTGHQHELSLARFRATQGLEQRALLARASDPWRAAGLGRPHVLRVVLGSRREEPGRGARGHRAAHETPALARHGLQEERPVRAVAEQLAQLAHGEAHRVATHGHVRPHVVHQLVAVHQSRGPRHQALEQAQDLGRCGNALGARPERALLGVQPERMGGMLGGHGVLLGQSPR